MPLNTISALALIVAVTSIPVAGWFFVRRLWMSRQEKRVLLHKYGDVDMFADRLQEWKIVQPNKEKD